LRNFPGVDATSRLSVDLHFGTIHPRQIVRELTESDRSFLSEICWREFYADVLYHRPDSVVAPLNAKFVNMTFRRGEEAEADFDRWRSGMTGYPIVDAGMRQLKESGWMHNRVRMITASFLVKDLHLDWRWGMRHFSATLADADTASNVHGWQWVAGCGTDASPYYRVFNPTLQGQRFDPDGDYVRRWVPELAGLSGEWIHTPWDAPMGLFERTAAYPARIVDHDVERQIALEAYEELKNA
ncbi:MAG: cryptochrome/photolyase family protein, partial [Acidimicrobiales bacterium]